jgi:hypothetical protein
MILRFLFIVSILSLTVFGFGIQSHPRKPASQIVSGKPIPSKPTLNASPLRWSIKVTRDKHDTPSSVVYLVVGKHAHFVAKVSGNEIRPMARELYVGWGVPAKSVIASFGWFAGGGDIYYVLRKSHRLKIYHRAIDESDKEPQRPECIRSIKI